MVFVVCRKMHLNEVEAACKFIFLSCKLFMVFFQMFSFCCISFAPQGRGCSLIILLKTADSICHIIFVPLSCLVLLESGFTIIITLQVAFHIANCSFGVAGVLCYQLKICQVTNAR